MMYRTFLLAAICPMALGVTCGNLPRERQPVDTADTDVQMYDDTGETPRRLSFGDPVSYTRRLDRVGSPGLTWYISDVEAHNVGYDGPDPENPTELRDEVRQEMENIFLGVVDELVNLGQPRSGSVDRDFLAAQLFSVDALLLFLTFHDALYPQGRSLNESIANHQLNVLLTGRPGQLVLGPTTGDDLQAEFPYLDDPNATRRRR